MTREEVRNFLGLGIDLLTDVTYGSGRISEWNSDRNRTYPMCWISQIEASTELANGVLPIDNWSIEIHIAKKDTADSIEEQYEALVDDCDYMAQQLIRYYNQVVTGYKLVTISSISRPRFVKKNADCLTGVILSFTMTAPDTTNLC
jgi:hypothetical protein